MIKVNLIGGIGNQLFQYYAGLQVAEGRPERLVVKSRFSQFGRTGHNSLIKELGLPGRFTVARYNRKSLLALSLASRVVESFFGSLASRWHTLIPIFGAYVSPVAGHDPALESSLRGSRRLSIWGFFQSWKHADDLLAQGRLPKPRIEDPTEWFTSQMAKQNEKRVLTVHVRRGDYRGLSETLGILDEEYYLSAISSLRAMGAEWEEAWIYTDEVEALEKEMPQFLAQENFRIASPPASSHPGESLLAIANADYIIIANSTFSWWSAFFSTRCSIVIRPSKWFKGKSDPDFLFPESWMSSRSHWRSGPSR